jgi:hypothetical protein
LSDFTAVLDPSNKDGNHMKLILGILGLLGGGLVLIIGLIVCINSLTSDYASSACERAENDREAFSEARARCGSPTTDCFKQATIGLTTEEECEAKTSFMRNQLIIGVVVAVVGGFVSLVGIVLIILGIVGRRKKVAVAT